MNLRLPFLTSLLAALALLAPSPAPCSEEKTEDALPVAALKSGVNAADTTHEYLSDRMEELARQLDSFLGGKQALDEDTGSYFSARLERNYVRGLPPEWRFDSKFLLVLPRTQERFDLEFDTEKFLENLGTSSTADRVNPPGGDESQTNRPDSLFAGIRAILFRNQNWRATMGGGVRVVWPPDPYLKMNLSYRTPIPLGWKMKVENGVFWYRSKGYSDRAQLLFTHPAFTESTVNVATAAYWTDVGDGWKLGETVSLLTPFGEDTAVAARVGGLWETDPVFRDIEYFTDFTVRRRIYSTWLFAEARASLAWPRGSGFEPTPGIFLTLEMFMGGKKRGFAQEAPQPAPAEVAPPPRESAPVPDPIDWETMP